MLFTEKLKEKLGEEAFKKIEEDIAGKEVYVLDPKDYLPAEKIKALREEAKTLKTDNEKLVADLETERTKVTELEKAKGEQSKTIEEQLNALSEKTAALEETIAEKDKALERAKKLSVLKDHLNTAKVNPKYLKHAIGEFDIEKLEIDESGKIVGWDEMVKPVQENFPDFFGENKLAGSTPEPGGLGVKIDDDQKEYNTLMSKDNLTPLETAKAMELAQKIKDKKNKEE